MHIESYGLRDWKHVLIKNRDSISGLFGEIVYKKIYARKEMGLLREENSFMKYTIGACGFSGTGSSAVSDYLKEFEENIVLDSLEFSIPYLMDGLQDLRYHLHEGGMRDFQCRLAIKRYRDLCGSLQLNDFQRATHGRFRALSEQYIKDLIQFEFVGRDRDTNYFGNVIDKIYKKMRVYHIISKIEKKKKREICIYPLKYVAFSVYPENFEERTRKYVSDILVSMGSDEGKNVVLDQPFPGNNPMAAFPFFENPKAIVVDRDPRDVYLLTKDFWRPGGFRAIPAGNPREYCMFHRKLRENMPYLNDNPNVLRIQFEDMIYRYEETTELIRQFCNLEPNKNQKRFFNPEKSIANTQVYKRYPEFAEDVRYIEEELSDYLYPFEKYGSVDTSGKMFE